jgi:hypothetical protein
VLAEAGQPIGKEADKLEERESFGSDDAEIEYDLSPPDRAKLTSMVKMAKKEFGLRQLSAAAKVSHHCVNDIIRGKAVSGQILVAVRTAAQALRSRTENQHNETQILLRKLRQHVAREGRSAVAREVGIDPSNLAKLMTGQRKLNSVVQAKLRRYLLDQE